MSHSVTARLIAKDLYLYRWLIAGAMAAGVASLAVSSFGEGDNVRTGINFGILLFVTTMVAFGIFIPMYGIFKERQEKSQLFALSLPVSPAQYAIAKVVAALVAFLVPWLLLTAGVLVLAEVTGDSNGAPLFVVMMMGFLANFCILTALIAVTMSEVWAVAGILITNVSVTLFLAKLGDLTGTPARGGAATWSPTILTLLGIEIALIALSLALAFYLPSRRKDFV